MDFDCDHLSCGISSVCIAEECTNSFLCQRCLPNHDSSHFVYIRPLQELMECDWNYKVNEIRKLISNSATYKRKIKEQYHQVLDKIKDEFDHLLLKFKDSINDRVTVKNIQNSLYIDTLVVQLEALQHQYAKDNNPNSDHARSILSSYLEAYRNFEEQAKHMTKKIEVLCANAVAKVDFGNEIDDVIMTIEESLSKFEAAYFEEFYIKENKEQNNAGDQVKLSTNFDVSMLAKEAIIKLSAPPSWNSFDFVGYQSLLVSGDQHGNIGAWNATNLKNLVHEKLHEGPVNNVLYYKKGGYMPLMTV